MAKQYQYTKTKEIFSKEKELPNLPGVYKFSDEKNKILYIGKAKSLSNEMSNSLSHCPCAAKTLARQHQRATRTSGEFENVDFTQVL